MKRIRDSHQNVWGHDHKIVRKEQKHSLAEDCTSFKMRRMTTKGNQLLCIDKAIGSKMYTRELEVGPHGTAKALVLSSNSSMPIFTGFMRKVPPGQCWASKAYTLVMPLASKCIGKHGPYITLPMVF